MSNKSKNFMQIVVKLVVISVLFEITIFLFQIAPYYKESEKFDPNVVRVTIDDKDVTNSLPDEVFVENDIVMMSAETLMKYFKPYVYYDNKYDTVIITSAVDVVKIKNGTNIMNVNGVDESLSGNTQIKEIKAESGEKDYIVYVPINSLQEIFDITVDFNEKVNVTTPNSLTRMKVVTVEEKTRVRTYKKEFSRNNGYAKKNEKLYIFDPNDKTDDGYVKVKNERGDIGYALLEDIRVKNVVSEPTINQVTDAKNKKISLVWEYAENYTPNREGQAKIDGLDVISPTWLYLKDSLGNLEVTTDKTYFNWAKKQGYLVWPTLKNDFTSLEETSQVITDMNLREKFIEKILAYALANKFDGINIDFEYMNKADKNEFSEFVRELSARLRANDITVSVDVTIPGGSDTYSLCYDRKALANAVDYMMLMAYDQYGSWSKNPGPNASISWVENNIETMLGYEGVSKEKLILCVPFYSRYWKVDSESGVRKGVSTLTMKSANDYLEKYKNKAVWNEEDGQYYVEYTEKGTTTKIWIDNEEALKKKIELIEKYDLAGVAAWRWGYEDGNEVWNVIKNME